MISAQRQRLVPMIILNLLLAVVLLFVLDHFQIFSWRSLLKSKPEGETQKPILEDPFLLEKEELRKQWQVLEEKERLYQERVGEFDKKEQVLDEKLKEADNQIKMAREMQSKQEEIKKQYEDRQANVRNLASKIGNMPPKDGVALLERMDPVLAVDVLKEMDVIALQAQKKSITDYLLSLMDKEKASTIIRLMSRYPSNPGSGVQAPLENPQTNP